MKILATQIERDRHLQARVKLSPAKVREYADKMADGEPLPPIDVFRDAKNPDKFWLADGWHRDAAAASLGRPDRECCVHEGGQAAALRWALGANVAHGLPRSNADKRRAVQLALQNEELRRLSDRQIAEIVRVSHESVRQMRRELSNFDSRDSDQATFDDLRQGRDGKVRRMPRRHQDENQKARTHLRVDVVSSERIASFNVREARLGLERHLADEIRRWPEEKRHAFCVMLRNFTVEHDPEIQTMKRNAFDELYAKAREQREAAEGGEA